MDQKMSEFFSLMELLDKAICTIDANTESLFQRLGPIMGCDNAAPELRLKGSEKCEPARSEMCSRINSFTESIRRISERICEMNRRTFE